MRLSIIYVFAILTLLLGLFQGCKSSSLDRAQASPPEIPKTRELEYSGLKAWSDQAFAWDEAKIAAAVSSKELVNLLGQNKVDLVEFDKVLKLMVESYVKSPMAGATNWLKEKPGSEFYDIKHFGRADSSKINAQEVFYAQKIRIPQNSSIIVMGDFHGSLHSLLRNLWRLHAAGYVDNNFKIIKENTYLICTGDFVDRGRYSVETLYTLMRLKLANFDKVYLLRGNHENEIVSTRHGFKKELFYKYGHDRGDRLFKDITDFYRFLPIFTFAEVEGPKTSFVHFSHGGFSYDANKKQLIHSPANLLKDKKALYELIPVELSWGYMWADFRQGDESFTNSTRGFDEPETGVSKLGSLATSRYFQEINSKTGGSLVGIFRGHQDREFGVKMFFKNEPSVVELTKLKANNLKYFPEGPFHWEDIIKNPMDRALARTGGVLMTPYRPIFTFTSAAEGQGVPFDSFGIIKLGFKAEESRLEIHEMSLEKNRPDRSYVSISPSKSPEDDGISITWSDLAPGHVNILP